MNVNKPSILYLITQSELGGAQRYVFDLANNLKEEFDVAVAFGEQGEKGELAKKLAKNGIKYHSIPRLKRSISPLNDYLALKEIIKLIKEIEPNILHLNSSKISILGSLAALSYKLQVKSKKLKVVYTAHGWVFNEPLCRPIKKFYYYAEKFTSYFKDLIICVSEYDRRIGLKNKIAPGRKLKTIHNGIEPITFLDSFNDKRPPNPIPVIGSIGNLYKTKGYEYLLKALNILVHEQKTPISLFIVGDGPEKFNLLKLTSKYNLKNYVNFSGRIYEAFRILPSFDIYACSSIKEGLSYTLIEAMQAGLPIVTTNVGGNPELIADGINGLLVKPHDEKDLAQKIKTLLANKKLSEKLGAEAQKKAEQEFGLETMVRKTKEEYLKLV